MGRARILVPRRRAVTTASMPITDNSFNANNRGAGFGPASHRLAETLRLNGPGSGGHLDRRERSLSSRVVSSRVKKQGSIRAWKIC